MNQSNSDDQLDNSNNMLIIDKRKHSQATRANNHLESDDFEGKSIDLASQKSDELNFD
jgi:hypothetical protein